MTFTSLLFYPCLAAAVTGFYWTPLRRRPLYLLLLSYAFYAILSPATLPLLFATSAFTYGAGLWLEGAGEKEKSWILSGSIALLVAVIVGFKLAQATDGWLIPLGLSYYTFKLISYLMDVHWESVPAERNAVRFFLYPAFFAQIPSGPIQRADDFLSQLATGRAGLDFGKFVAGIKLILGGLILKLVIGDRLGAFTDLVDQAPTAYSRVMILTVVACYTLQLFADFAGYTNIAIGIAKLFGIDSPPNFAAPFAAPNTQEFWRRWHMTLTSWVTDYLFFPLSMALRSYGTAGLMFCIAVSMAIIGLWHGLTANFLIFGLCHAAFVSLTVLTRTLRDRLFGTSRMDAILRTGGGIVLTFAMMSFSQIFWHAPDLATALLHFRLLFGLQPAGTMILPDLPTEFSEYVVICSLIAFYVGAGVPGWNRIQSLFRVRMLPDWAVCGGALFLLSALAPDGGGHFIYGQF